MYREEAPERISVRRSRRGSSWWRWPSTMTKTASKRSNGQRTTSYLRDSSSSSSMSARSSPPFLRQVRRQGLALTLSLSIGRDFFLQHHQALIECEDRFLEDNVVFPAWDWKCELRYPQIVAVQKHGLITFFLKEKSVLYVKK